MGKLFENVKMDIQAERRNFPRFLRKAKSCDRKNTILPGY